MLPMGVLQPYLKSVTDAEINAAILNRGQLSVSPKTRERIRRNIALGKMCGSYQAWVKPRAGYSPSYHGLLPVQPRELVASRG